MTTDEFATYDGAYVLGALSPADRRDFEEHLRVCAACAGSVSELAGLPGLMSKVAIEQLSAPAEPLPQTLLASLARAVRRQRLRRALVAGVSAAAAAALIGVGSVAATRAQSPTPAPVTASAPASPNVAAKALTAVVASPVSARAALVDMAWGTRIDLTCDYHTQGLYPSSAVTYAMVVIDRHGTAAQVATWKALPNRELTVMGATSAARPDIAAVEIRTLAGQTILRLTT